MARPGTLTKKMFNCPACKVPVQADLYYDIKNGETVVDGDSITVKAKLTGVNVSHNCVPKVTR